MPSIQRAAQAHLQGPWPDHSWPDLVAKDLGKDVGTVGAAKALDINTMRGTASKTLRLLSAHA